MEISQRLRKKNTIESECGGGRGGEKRKTGKMLDVIGKISTKALNKGPFIIHRRLLGERTRGKKRALTCSFRPPGVCSSMRSS